jgi:hypothetical protein
MKESHLVKILGTVVRSSQAVPVYLLLADFVVLKRGPCSSNGWWAMTHSLKVPPQ